MIIQCPQCNTPMDVSSVIGNQARCPNCQTVVTFPVSPPQAATAVPLAAVPIQVPADMSVRTPIKTCGMAVASLVLGIIGFLTSFIGIGVIFGIIALILGLVALSKIRKNPMELSGSGMAIAGSIFGGLPIVFIPLYALIAIPNFVALRSKAYDASAQSAGRNAKLAEEVYYNDHGGDISGGYTSNLRDLLVYDRNLSDDLSVTFSFVKCDTSGYTFTTKHDSGKTIYTWTD